jgi:hypothetical protein
MRHLGWMGLALLAMLGVIISLSIVPAASAGMTEW